MLGWFNPIKQKKTQTRAPEIASSIIYLIFDCMEYLDFCRKLILEKGRNFFTPSNMKTLPKAQRTRGLSSTYQGNLFRSYQKLKHKS